LKISAPRPRATPKGASVGGGYMKNTNTGSAADIAGQVELHEMSMDNGVMKMRPVANGIEIKPGQVVEFKPGSYHVMFVGLKGALEQGELVRGMLEFEKASKVDVDFTVEGIGTQTGGDQAMPGMMMQHYAGK
jgi:copper(I)-binding protein